MFCSSVRQRSPWRSFIPRSFPAIYEGGADKPWDLAFPVAPYDDDLAMQRPTLSTGSSHDNTIKPRTRMAYFMLLTPEDLICTNSSSTSDSRPMMPRRIQTRITALKGSAPVSEIAFILAISDNIESPQAQATMRGIEAWDHLTRHPSGPFTVFPILRGESISSIAWDWVNALGSRNVGQTSRVMAPAVQADIKLRRLRMLQCCSSAAPLSEETAKVIEGHFGSWREFADAAVAEGLRGRSGQGQGRREDGDQNIEKGLAAMARLRAVLGPVSVQGIIEFWMEEWYVD